MYQNKVFVDLWSKSYVFSETKNKENAFKHFDLVKMSNQNV